MSSSPEITRTQLIVGMEVHVELATRSKMFTRAANVAHPDHYDAEPNALVDAVVLALPGTLPVMNKRAVEMSMLVGLALDCTISSFSRWDRKNYFYPDLPKGYQISQYDLPLCYDGQLTIDSVDGNGEAREKNIGIIRGHLEEDAGKLSHELPGGGHTDDTLVDLNRAGTPLLEIVSEPDMTSAEDAVTYCRELHGLCRWLGVTEGVMQRGHMRFEPNVNVVIHTADGKQHATPIAEMKNLNSFRAVKAAIEYEHDRQIEQWKKDGLTQSAGAKSTRGWDDERGVTFLQRSKEDAHDYRYFPDPDLPPVTVSDEWRESVAVTLPELPRVRRRRYLDEYSLSEIDAATLTDDRALSDFYESCVAANSEHAASIAKLLLNTAARRSNEVDQPIPELGASPQQIAELVALREENAIGSGAQDELFDLLCETNTHVAVAKLAEERGLLQINDDSQLDDWLDAAIAAHPDAAEDFAAGKDAAGGRIIGAVMQASGGQADAKAVREKLVARLR